MDLRQIVGAQADVFELQALARRVQDAEHRLFAVLQRDRRDAQVHLPSFQFHAHRSVLREPPLGDVETAEDLHARHQRRVQRDRHLEVVGQQAVEPEANRALRHAGLDVDVAGAKLDRLAHDEIHQLDDWGILGIGVQRAGFLGAWREVRCGRLPDALRHQTACPLQMPGVESFDGVLDLGPAAESRRHLAPRDEGEVPNRLMVHGVGHHDIQPFPFQADRQDGVLARQCLGDQVELVRAQGQGGDVGVGELELNGQEGDELRFRDLPAIEENLPDAPARLVLFLEGLVEDLSSDELPLDQKLPEPRPARGLGPLCLLRRLLRAGLHPCSYFVTTKGTKSSSWTVFCPSLSSMKSTNALTTGEGGVFVTTTIGRRSG